MPTELPAPPATIATLEPTYTTDERKNHQYALVTLFGILKDYPEFQITPKLIGSMATLRYMQTTDVRICKIIDKCSDEICQLIDDNKPLKKAIFDKAHRAVALAKKVSSQDSHIIQALHEKIEETTRTINQADHYTLACETKLLLDFLESNNLLSTQSLPPSVAASRRLSH